MIGDTRRHAWSSFYPFLNKKVVSIIYFFSETHMRSGNIVKCLKQSRLFSEIGLFLLKPRVFLVKGDNAWRIVKLSLSRSEVPILVPSSLAFLPHTLSDK